MRVLHVFDHSLPLQSGYVSRSLSIIRSQRARGWETLHLTTPRYQPSAEKAEFVDGFKFHRSPKVSIATPVLRELAEMQVTRRALFDVVRLHRPDVIHAHSPALTAWPAIFAGRQFRLPVVYEVRALWEDAAVDYGATREGAMRYRLSRQLETAALRRADAVITLCNPLRDEIIERGIEPDRVAVVPNAVDREFVDPGSSTADQSSRAALGLGNRFVLGFIGSFYAYEGLDLLLRAVPRLRAVIPEVLVLLVGGGPDEQRLRNIVHELGIAQSVQFTGRVHHTEVPGYYHAADIMVFPRRKSRLTDLVTPLKPLEAMARGKPVVASDVGGHRELIRHNHTGYLVCASDIDHLVATLVAVSRNLDDRTRVALNGRRFVEAERTWTKVSEVYAGVYSRLLSGSRNFPQQLAA